MSFIAFMHPFERFEACLALVARFPFAIHMSTGVLGSKGLWRGFCFLQAIQFAKFVCRMNTEAGGWGESWKVLHIFTKYPSPLQIVVPLSRTNNSCGWERIMIIKIVAVYFWAHSLCPNVATMVMQNQGGHSFWRERKVQQKSEIFDLPVIFVRLKV